MLSFSYFFMCSATVSEHPTGWVNLNYGGRISFTKTDNLSNYFDIENEKEKLNPNFSNAFNYKKNSHAIYFSAKKSFSDKYEIKAGLRYELSQTKGFSKTLQQTHENDYSKFFPTVYFSYTPNDHHSFSINYGKRIERPGYGSLNPFRFVFNSYYEGNPFLKPYFTDNIEFEYAFKDHLITTIYYSYTDDDFEQVTILDKTTNVRKVTTLNFLVNNMFGVYQIFIFKPFQWWEVNASADVYYSGTRSKIPVTLQYLSGWNGEFNISNDFILNKNKTLLANISCNYTTKGVDHLYYNSSANQLDASVKWLLIDKKLIISFYINDLLSSNRFTYKTFSSGIENSIRNYHDERYFRLGVIYHFGKKFKRNNRARKNREEYNRIN